MCRQTLQERINAAYDKMKQQITDELNAVQYVCTTADLWSSANRSFLGMTAHWFTIDMLERKSVALACVRFKGKHSYDKIAQAISHTHANYSIEGKVIFTCTDNGSNIVKAFAEYNAQLLSVNSVQLAV